MPWFKNAALPLALCLASILFVPQPGLCNLKISIKKYLHVSIPSSDLDKVSRYDNLIDYYSGISYFRPDHKVSPDFIRALILAESACDPQAVSEKNALGLAQILPSTGKKAALELSRTNVQLRYIDRERLKNIQEEDLFDPAINILLTAILSQNIITNSAAGWNWSSPPGMQEKTPRIWIQVCPPPTPRPLS